MICRCLAASSCVWTSRSAYIHALQDDGVAAITQGLSGGDILEAGHSHNVAGAGHCDVLPAVGVHEQDLGDALLVALVAVEAVGALSQLAAAAPQNGLDICP